MRYFAALLALALLPRAALAHGGLPLSEKIIPRSGQLLVPTQFWGVFFGADGGPWRWICEEAINKKQDREWAFTLDGTYHVTNYSGITSSRDGGCTWVEATGEIAQRAPTDVVADPVDPKRAWVTTASGAMAPWNGLFTTVDDGATWTAVFQWDELLRGVAVSADGQTLYVVGLPRGMGPQTPLLHVSTDGAKTFTDYPVQYQLKGFTPPVIEPIAVDPKDPKVAYFRANTDPTRALLRTADGGATLTELFQVDGDIGNLSFDAARKSITVATAKGMMRSVASAPFAPSGDLSRAQCVEKVGDALYACSWNYTPDFAAIARSDDGGDHFVKVFQYDQTVGPTTDCAPTTPVGMICPGVWQMYADQLGITLDAPDMAGPPPPMVVCHCSLGANVSDRSHSGELALALLGLGLYGWLRRKAARPA